MRRLLLRLLTATVFRFACYAVMLWLALWGEARPAPSLPDVVLAHVPYVAWVDRYNYVLWLVAYVPVAIALLWRNPDRFVRYMVTAGLLALLRGVCIAVTGLGPVYGPDAHAGMSAAMRAQAFWELASPLGFFFRGAPHLYLTKDLFFSGHTATTLLLVLYVWQYPRLRAWMLAGHALVIASIFFSHLHYTIDVIGAYGLTFSVYCLREGLPRASPAAP